MTIDPNGVLQHEFCGLEENMIMQVKGSGQASQME